MRRSYKPFHKCVCVCMCVRQVARKLVVIEGELERAEERAEVSELYVHVIVFNKHTQMCIQK